MGYNVKHRVLFLSPVAHFKGGAEKCLMEFVENPNIKPAIAAPSSGPILTTAQEQSIPGHIIPFGGVETIRRPFSFIKGFQALQSLFSAAQTLKRTAQSENIEIVPSNGLKAHAINCISRSIGGAKAVIHIHDIPLTRQEKIVWYILYFLCDKMLMVSRPCWPGQKLPRKCRIIHNGTILKKVAQKNLDFRNGLTAGFVGRIHPAKGLHLLLNWVAFARINGINVKLSVRGSFSEDAPDYQEEIYQLVNHLNLKDFVEFKGHINEPDEIYAGLDFVVVPSNTPDPLPRSVMEPMAMGIPVFGYPAGGIPEMIENGKSGYLVKNEAEFTDSINKLLENYQLIVKSARDKISREFSLEGLYQELGSVYRELSE